MNVKMEDKNCLSYWYPKLLASGVPVPKTEIIETDCELERLLDGKDPNGFDKFIASLRAAMNKLGYPCFLRTGHCSGKHDWERTCYVPSAKEIENHVCALVEYSHLVDIMGLPTHVWAAREYIPMESSFTAFRGFPVNKERRYFIRDGEVVCHHCYWPHDAVKDGRPTKKDWAQRLNELNTDKASDLDYLREQSIKASKAIPGAWSLDWALSKDGRWYAIDMAEAHRSYHREGCPHAEEFK